MNRENVKNFFSLPSTQSRGFFVLGLILVLVIIAPAFYKAFLFKPKTIDLEQNRAEIQAFISSIQFKNQKKTTTTHSDRTINFENTDQWAAKTKLTPFSFDPNNLPAEQWLEMGLTERQVKSIKNYEGKGGRFRTKNDVNKMYAISNEEFEILKPYILLPDTLSFASNEQRTKKEFVKPQVSIIEINNADTAMLKTLPGIGPAYASRIVSYRNSLGGFHHKEQLLEVRGMDDERFQMFQQYIDINPWLIRKINVNTADFDRLNNHPYINYNVAISLVNYRNRHGHFLVLEDIMKSELIDQNLFQKLAPYLTVN